MMKIRIPFPPSVNSLYRTYRGRVIMSKDGRDWYKKNLPFITVQVPSKPLDSRIAIKIDIFPPDKRRRDVDNLLKVVFDVLTKAGAWVDDSLVDEIVLKRWKPVLDGFIDVHITTIKE